MSDVIVQTLYFIASYIGIILFLFGSLNWLTKGFIWKYLRVKMSKHKKILVEVVSMTGGYYAIGQIDSGTLRLKGKDRKLWTMDGVPKGWAYFNMGIFMGRVDEEGCNFILPTDSTSVKSNDPRTVSSLLKRALMAGRDVDKQTQIIFILIGLAIIVAGVSAYLAYDNSEQIRVLTEMVNSTRVIR